MRLGRRLKEGRRPAASPERWLQPFRHSMRYKLFFTSCLLTLLLSSCSLPFWAYIRNLTNETAIINVYNRRGDFSETLPTIKTADQVVKFKNGHRRFFTDTTNILWIDSTHFKVFLKPKTTIDFEDIAGHFLVTTPQVT